MMTKLVIVVVVILAVLVLLNVISKPTISSEEARDLVADGAKLVDVRTPEEYARGHIYGAVNIPLDKIRSRGEELGDRSGAIVLYCRSGARSARAKKELERLGFERVHNLGAASRW